MSLPRSIGLNCWNQDCRGSFGFDIPKGMRRARAYGIMDDAAGDAGWVIGLDLKGQAHYACPRCTDSLIDASILQDVRKPAPWPHRPVKPESTEEAKT